MYLNNLTVELIQVVYLSCRGGSPSGNLRKSQVYVSQMTWILVLQLLCFPVRWMSFCVSKIVHSLMVTLNALSNYHELLVTLIKLIKQIWGNFVISYPFDVALKMNGLNKSRSVVLGHTDLFLNLVCRVVKLIKLGKYGKRSLMSKISMYSNYLQFFLPMYYSFF